MADRDKPLDCPECGAKMDRNRVPGVLMDIWKPFTSEHMAAEPMTFNSKKELRDECTKRGVESGALL